LAICSQAGMPLVESLTLIAATNTNLYFKNAIILMREKIISGEPLQQAVQCSAFPSLLIQLVAVGEESGQLEAMLIQAGIFYEQEIDILVETLGTLLEPAIMVILGILIGGLIIAMYLPIFKIGQTF
jgi:type IV pilus assembly protein PilC